MYAIFFSVFAVSLFHFRREVAVTEGAFIGEVYFNCSAYSSCTIDDPLSVAVTGVMNSTDWTVLPFEE